MRHQATSGPEGQQARRRFSKRLLQTAVVTGSGPSVQLAAPARQLISPLTMRSCVCVCVCVCICIDLCLVYICTYVCRYLNTYRTRPELDIYRLEIEVQLSALRN